MYDNMKNDDFKTVTKCDFLNKNKIRCVNQISIPYNICTSMCRFRFKGTHATHWLSVALKTPSSSQGPTSFNQTVMD